MGSRALKGQKVETKAVFLGTSNQGREYRICFAVGGMAHACLSDGEIVHSNLSALGRAEALAAIAALEAA